MPKNISINISCAQNIRYLTRDRADKEISCLASRCCKTCSEFFIFGEFILSEFMRLAMCGIEKISIVAAMHIAAVSIRYCEFTESV